MRCDADYIATVQKTAVEVGQARKDAKYIVKTLEDILPSEKLR